MKKLALLLILLTSPVFGQERDVRANPSTGALLWPAAATFVSANGLITGTTVNGYFADPSTNGSFSASAWKTDLSLNLVENTALSTWAGTANITTVGTIGTGTWQGTAVANTYIATGLDAVKISGGAVTNTEFNYLDNVTSAIQTQFAGKLSLSGGTMTGQLILDSTGVIGPAGGTILTMGTGNDAIGEIRLTSGDSTAGTVGEFKVTTGSNGAVDAFVIDKDGVATFSENVIAPYFDGVTANAEALSFNEGEFTISAVEAEGWTVTGMVDLSNGFKIGTSEMEAVDGVGFSAQFEELSGSAVEARYTLGAGTAYTLTGSSALVDMGTTDPVKVIEDTGKYLLYANVQTSLVAATLTTQTVTVTIRRTNNTGADIVSRSMPLGVTTTLTALGPSVMVGPFPYETANTDDSLEIFANLSAATGAGSVTVTQADLIITPAGH